MVNLKTSEAYLTTLTTPLLRGYAKTVSKAWSDAKPKLVALATELVTIGGPAQLKFGANILVHTADSPIKLVHTAVQKLGAHPNWEVREEGAQLLRGLLAHDFDYWFRNAKVWVDTPDINLKRLALVGSMSTKLTDLTKIHKLVDHIFEPLLTLPDRYIKVNHGPFALGSFMLSKWPNVLFDYLATWSKSSFGDDENVRWNILMVFSQAHGQKYPHLAKHYIKLFDHDTRPVVKRAVKSLSRKFESEV